MSKSNFKAAVGMLIKSNHIVATDEGLWLKSARSDVTNSLKTPEQREKDAQEYDAILREQFVKEQARKKVDNDTFIPGSAGIDRVLLKNIAKAKTDKLNRHIGLAHDKYFPDEPHVSTLKRKIEKQEREERLPRKKGEVTVSPKHFIDGKLVMKSPLDADERDPAIKLKSNSASVLNASTKANVDLKIVANTSDTSSMFQSSSIISDDDVLKSSNKKYEKVDSLKKPSFSSGSSSATTSAKVKYNNVDRVNDKKVSPKGRSPRSTSKKWDEI